MPHFFDSATAYLPKGVTSGDHRVDRIGERVFVSAPALRAPGGRVYIAEVMAANSKEEQKANAAMLGASKDLMEVLNRILLNNRIRPHDRLLAEEAMGKATGKRP